MGKEPNMNDRVETFKALMAAANADEVFAAALKEAAEAKNDDAFIELAASKGIEITREELDPTTPLDERDLSDDELKAIAGGDLSDWVLADVCCYLALGVSVW